MKIYVYEGKNIDDLKKKALEELNKAEEELFIKVISNEEAGLFKSKKQKVEILIKDEVINYLKDLLKDITDKMGIEINIECKKRENYIKINVFSNNNAILIGKNGKTITSLQKILRHSILNNAGFYINLVLDVEDYKEKQQHYLIRDAIKIAKEVEASGVESNLDNMNSYERRLVHEALSTMNVITVSEGEEPNRYIVVRPNNK